MSSVASVEPAGVQGFRDAWTALADQVEVPWQKGQMIKSHELCEQAGINRHALHKSFGNGSVQPAGGRTGRGGYVVDFWNALIVVIGAWFAESTGEVLGTAIRFISRLFHQAYPDGVPVT